MSGDQLGPPTSDRGPRYARELIGLRDVLDNIETVGRPKRSTELATLRTLIDRYTDEARQMLAERDNR